MKETNLKKLVIGEFSGEHAQEVYKRMAETGFWLSEEVIIKKFFKKKGKVLDIGCGTGRTTIPLYKLGYKVVGIDLTPTMIKIAKNISKHKKLKIDYKVGDATNIKFKDNTFDYALFSNQGWTQIPNNKERIKSLKEVRRILKKQGIFIFSIHKRDWLGKYFFFLLWMWFKFYVLKNIGFKIDEQDFGDRFFRRETTSKTKYKNKQYIHIPSIKEVKEQIKEAKFELIFSDNARNISKGAHNAGMVFFVCKK